LATGNFPSSGKLFPGFVFALDIYRLLKSATLHNSTGAGTATTLLAMNQDFPVVHVLQIIQMLRQLRKRHQLRARNSTLFMLIRVTHIPYLQVLAAVDALF